MQECSICLLHLSSLESLVNLVHMFCLVFLFAGDTQKYCWIIGFQSLAVVFL